jgi:radical SAM superfamily enzyme YgiQ (UPF0313 family)
MRERGAILLVSCYELGHQPLGIAWAAAFLEARGYAPAVLDVSVEPFDPEKAARARLVAVSVPMHTALRVGLELIGRVRAVNPTCHVAAYGLYAQLNRDYLLSHGVDSVFGGEAEAPLVTLAETLEARAGEIGSGTGAGTAASSPLPHLARLSFPAPSRAALPSLKQYARLERGGRHELVGYVEASRGCKHLCRHCPIPPVYGGRFFAVPREFRSLGCAFVVSAVESLSDTVLAHLDKGHTRADILTLVRLMREAGIALRPTWVAFTPWTTLDDYRVMLDFVDAEDLVDAVDPVQYSLRLLVPPGSLLAGQPAMRPHLGPLVEDAFSHAWSHPDARMDALQGEVARVVQEAAEARADEASTFDRVRALAAAQAGVPPRRLEAGRSRPDRARPPRLTEPWFC